MINICHIKTNNSITKISVVLNGKKAVGCNRHTLAYNCCMDCTAVIKYLQCRVGENKKEVEVSHFRGKTTIHMHVLMLIKYLSR